MLPDDFSVSVADNDIWIGIDGRQAIKQITPRRKLLHLISVRKYMELMYWADEENHAVLYIIVISLLLFAFLSDKSISLR